MKINPYLSFNGNCKTAFDYYVKHLGATLVMAMTYGEMPESEGEPCSPVIKDRIMHARLLLGDSLLMGSDSPPERFQPPTGVWINLGLASIEEAERVFAALSENATILMPLAESFWAHRFALLTDQFGTPWMINCEKSDY